MQIGAYLLLEYSLSICEPVAITQHRTPQEDSAWADSLHTRTACARHLTILINTESTATAAARAIAPANLASSLTVTTMNAPATTAAAAAAAAADLTASPTQL